MGVRGFESDIVENFSLGVVTSVLKDRLPDGASPESKNSQFYNIGPERAIFGTRAGCTVQNTTSVGAAIISQYFLNTDLNNVHLLVDSDGDLKKIVSGTVSDIDATLFTELDNQFSWQTVNNYAYVVNGEDKFKTEGTTAYNFGIEQPNSGDWGFGIVPVGGVIPDGTYDAVITYYNANTGYEGPISAIKTVTINPTDRLRVNLPSISTIDDPQVTHSRIYLRRQATQSEFYFVAAGATPASSGTDGWAVGVGTTSVDIDATSAQIAAFRIKANGENENYAPPDGTKFIANHKGRMFAATDTEIYWSKPGQPEAFNVIDDSLLVGEDDGEVITGMVEFKDLLVIFKQGSTYVLVGTDPATWEIELIDKTVGCTSYNGIGHFDNRLFWMSLGGPRMWAGTLGAITDITTELIGPNFDEDHIDPEDLANSIVIGHPIQNYVAWAVTPTGESRNSKIIPFNFKTNRWMASEWNMVDVRSSTVVLDSDGRPWPMVGDYDGTIYKVGMGDDDGVPLGEDPTGLVTASSSTTLTNSAATWASNVLIGRYVYVWNDNNGLRIIQRRRITANTSTQLTITPAFDSLPNVGDNYSLGGIFFDWRNGFRSGGGPFYRKRIEFLFLEAATPAGALPIDVEIYTDLDSDTPVMSRRVIVGAGDAWDEGEWDEMKWATFGSIRKRIPVRKVGYSWQVRVLSMANAGSQVHVYRTAVQWQTKTKKTSSGI